jgi:hypothetical protein
VRLDFNPILQLKQFISTEWMQKQILYKNPALARHGRMPHIYNNPLAIGKNLSGMGQQNYF